MGKYWPYPNLREALIAALERFIHWVIQHPGLLEDQDKVRRCYLLITFSLVLSTIAVLFLPVTYFHTGHPSWSMVLLAISGGLVALNPLLLRWTGSLLLPSLLLPVEIFLFVTYDIYVEGFLFTTFMWVFIIPLVSVFLVGIRLGALNASMVVGGLFFLNLLEERGLLSAQLPVTDEISALGMVNFAALLVVITCLAWFYDVARERNLKVIRASEARFQTLFNAMHEGIALCEILYDERGRPYNGRFIALNPAFEKLSGLKAPDIVGHTVCEISRKLAMDWVDLVCETARTGKPAQAEYDVPDRQSHFEVMAFCPQAGELVLTLNDITPRKQAEKMLRSHHERLETLVNERTTELQRANQQLQQEVAVRQQVEEALREREALFRTIAETIPVPLVISRASDGKILFANEQISFVAGVSPAEIVGKRALDFYHDPTDHQLILEQLEKEGTVRGVEVRGRHWVDGTPMWISLSATAMHFGGEPAILTTFLDITTRKQAEEIIETYNDHLEELVAERTAELQRINEKLQAEIAERRRMEEELRRREMQLAEAQQIADIGSWEWDIATDTVTWSEQLYRIFGLGGDQFDGSLEGFLKWVHPDDRARVNEITWQVLKAYQPYEIEYRIVRPDGNERIVHERAKVVLDDAGRPVKVVGTAQDVTSRKQAERQLNILSSAVEQSAEAVMITDRNVVIQYVNPAFEKLTGYTEEELIGRRPSVLKSGKHDPQFYEEFLQTVLAGQVFRGEFINRRKNGELYFHEQTISPIRDATGQITHLVSTGHDTTERRRALQLELANQAKSEFLANMSHELRTPLNAVIGFADILMAQYFGPLTARQNEYVADILESGEYLLSLINDVLDLSKIEAGKMDLEYSEFRIGDVVEESVRLINERAYTYGIDLQMEVAPDITPMEGDRRKIKQVLFNLLSNAVKFTPAGGCVRVVADVAPDDLAVVQDIRRNLPDPDADLAFIRVAVEDTGIGIAPQDQVRLFTPFTQIENPAISGERGTGLGLALSRKIVELHGGHIWVESEGLGQGSRFVFVVPAEPLFVCPETGRTIPRPNAVSGLPAAPEQRPLPASENGQAEHPGIRGEVGYEA